MSSGQPVRMLILVLVGGFLALTLCGRGQSSLEAHTQIRESEPDQAPEPDAEIGRYQIASWSFGATLVPEKKAALGPAQGAYVIDTKTGEVWSIIKHEKPVSLGKVGANAK